MSSLILPVVLVGGRSMRFGRDKLREPVGGGAWLIDRPISAFRVAFGPQVVAIGDCHPDVAARADRVMADNYPGAGPAGGILSALQQFHGDVFVLAGDLPNVTADTVRALVDAAERHPAAWAVLGHGDALEPCIGIYRQFVREQLRARVERGQRSLHDLVPAAHLHCVRLSHHVVTNINTVAAMREAGL